MPIHEWRRVRGTQEIIVQPEPDEAVATLPALLGEPNDRARLVALLDKLMADRPRAREFADVCSTGDARAHPRRVGEKARAPAADAGPGAGLSGPRAGDRDQEMPWARNMRSTSG